MVMLPGPFYHGYKGKIWPTVIFFLALCVLGGLAMIGYPPARFLFGLLDRLRPILGWALFILFLYFVFWPKPE
jgi:hypothetical protein